MKKGTTYLSQDEIDQILEMTKKGVRAQEIADKIGRSRSAVYHTLTKHSVEIRPAVREMTYREMIKALYDAGYRIENNQLVVYQKQVVKLGDVVNNG